MGDNLNNARIPAQAELFGREVILCQNSDLKLIHIDTLRYTNDVHRGAKHRGGAKDEKGAGL